MRAAGRASPSAVPSARAVPRLLAGVGDGEAPLGLHAHLAQWGHLPLRALRTGLVPELEASGLAGHGGAWFPTGAKWRSIGGHGSRRPVVVANAAEGEPASSKDELLLARAPHLVLDGLVAAAVALRARRSVVYAPARLVPVVEAALGERGRQLVDPVPVELVEAPGSYLSGQESAVVRAVEGADALPTFVALRPVRQRGVEGRPTLVQNVETLANVALVARFGATWFRQAGVAHAPGTLLLTVTGRWQGRRVVEVPLGTRLGDVLGVGPHEVGTIGGVLLGGYGGAWLRPESVPRLPLTEADARRSGATLGAGVVVVLPRTACPVVETARLVRYLDGQKAGQCGPCVNGLADLVVQCDQLAFGASPRRGHVDAALETCMLVDGRGACRHPDGAARLVRSMVAAFGDHLGEHLRRGPCAADGTVAALPGVPEVRGAVPGSRRRVGGRA